jgi:hypothetical protein
MICDNEVIFQVDADNSVMQLLETSTEMLYLSGYMLLNHPSRQTVLNLKNCAKRVGVLTVLDLVPHDINNHIDINELIDLISGVDILSVSLITLNNIFPDATSSKEWIVNRAFSQLNIEKLMLVSDDHGKEYFKFDGYKLEQIKTEDGGIDNFRGKGEYILFKEGKQLLKGINYAIY